MFDHRWLRPSEAELLLPDRHRKAPGPRWRRPEDKPAPSPARPRRKP